MKAAGRFRVFCSFQHAGCMIDGGFRHIEVASFPAHGGDSIRQGAEPCRRGPRVYILKCLPNILGVNEACPDGIPEAFFPESAFGRRAVGRCRGAGDGDPADTGIPNGRFPIAGPAEIFPVCPEHNTSPCIDHGPICQALFMKNLRPLFISRKKDIVKGAVHDLRVERPRRSERCFNLDGVARLEAPGDFRKGALEGCRNGHGQAVGCEGRCGHQQDQRKPRDPCNHLLPRK